MILIENDYFVIIEREQKLFIKVFAPNYSIKDFPLIMNNNPRITVTKFLALKSALEAATNDEIEFGRLKPPIDLSITVDNMEAKIIIRLNEDILKATLEAVKEDIYNLLKEHNIVYGILYDVINKDLVPHKEIVIAKGLFPVDGNDAQVTYLKMPETKPTIKEDGSANFYEMNLIKHVQKGDWLGEKHFFTLGTNGMNIKGEILPAKPGRDKPLRFDEDSVKVTTYEDKEVLTAKFDGALQVKQGKIGVQNHLVIQSNVGYETGNINFDGYVTIYGTVEDGFSVTAEKDIAILGDMGMGAVEKICSKSGNVFIKGGISGKGKSVVEAGKSIFVKYANDAILKAEESIDIGYYALNCHLEADTILVQAKNARTIGGTIYAKTKVSLRMVGNEYEKETIIKVEGFDRKTIKKELDDLLITYKTLLAKAEQTERELQVYEITLTHFGKIKSDEDYASYQAIYQETMDKLYILEQKRQVLLKILSSKGDGEISVREKAYPRTFLEIKHLQKSIKEVTTGTFYAQDNQLMFI